MLQYTPQYVSSNTVLILRRTNFITTASGIVTLFKHPYSMQMESGLQSALHLHTVRLLKEGDDTRGCGDKIGPRCSKHVEECSVTYTGCPRRNGQNFGRVFLMLKYTDITQNIYIQSWTVTEIMAREVWNFDSCYTLIDYQIHIKTGRHMWFL